MLSKFVESGYVPGLVYGVWRNGDLTVESLGRHSFGGAQMRPDTIFRIASITKPVTAVAALILVEEGKLSLDEPVDSLLPELADREVLRRIDAALDDVVPAKRSITLRDLLGLTFGVGAIMEYPPRYPIQAAMSDAGVAPGPALVQQSPEVFMQRLGQLPLLAQPGEEWFYHTGLDVAGILIARAAEQSLSSLMRDRIFEPLGMNDTAFFVAPNKRDRLASPYAPDSSGDRVIPFDAAWIAFDRPPASEWGGGGLVSTVPDYMKFCRMLLGRGSLDGTRIISAASVAQMTENHLSPRQRDTLHAKTILGDTAGWGLGFSVELGGSPLHFPAGTVGWNGGYGTTAYLDPSSEVAAVLFTQRMMSSPEPPLVNVEFWRGVFP